MGRLADWRRVARTHPMVADALLATVLFAASLLPVDPPGGPPRDPLSLGAVLLALIGCAALALRRRYPLPVLGVTLAAVVLAFLSHQARGPFVLTVAVAAYTVAAGADRRTAVTAGGASGLLLGAASAATLGVSWYDPAVMVLLLGMAAAVSVGDAVRSQRAYRTLRNASVTVPEATRRDGDAPAEPAPSLTRLDALMEGSGTGQPVRWKVGGQPRPLPGAVDVAAYRIIQESLANAARHAPGAAVAVRLRYEPHGVTIEVRDDGPAVTGPDRTDGGVPPAGAGSGLAALRERARAVGGTFSAGPRPDGGWLVRAELPAPEDPPEA